MDEKDEDFEDSYVMTCFLIWGAINSLVSFVFPSNCNVGWGIVLIFLVGVPLVIGNSTNHAKYLLACQKLGTTIINKKS